jgi:hypothetical protein
MLCKFYINAQINLVDSKKGLTIMILKTMKIGSLSKKSNRERVE